MPNPKYSIKNFTKDNIYWLKNMLPVKVGGNNILSESSRSAKLYDDTSNGLSSLGSVSNITGMTSSFITSSSIQTLFGIDGANIFAVSPFGFTSESYGLIHTVPTSGNMYPSTYADIAITPNNTLIYITASYLGMGYFFTATDGSSTTLTVSTEDFSALGASSSAGHNKIYDLKLKQEYTITALEDSNHRLKFDAVAGKTPAAGDKFFVFIDEKTGFDFNTAASYLTPDVHFIGQNTPATWNRKIINMDGRYYILNGNYLAMLPQDESDLTEDYQQLPFGVQGVCGACNNDLILIGGYSKDNVGTLMVYDGFSTYFKSIINTDSIPASIVPYQNGWIVIFSNGEIRYTDGVSYKMLSKLPDSELGGFGSTIYYNGVTILGERLYISCGSNTVSLRQKNGCHVYSIESDIWSFVPLIDKYGYLSSTVGCLYKLSPSSAHASRIYYGRNYSICNIFLSGSSAKKEIYLAINLPKKEKISQIDLNFSYNYRTESSSDNDTSPTATVTVSSSDGRYGIFGYNQIGTGTTKSSIKVPYYNGISFVGQEIQMISTDTSDKNGDEYTYITAINDTGLTSENWDISPEFTENPAASQELLVYGFNYGESKTINYKTINKDNTFKINDFYGDKLYLHIRIDGALDLYGINII